VLKRSFVLRIKFIAGRNLVLRNPLLRQAPKVSGNYNRRPQTQRMTTKNFKIKADEFVDLVPQMGGCFATDKITVDGLRVGYMS
jgi:hypothetical protein